MLSLSILFAVSLSLNGFSKENTEEEFVVEDDSGKECRPHKTNICYEIIKNGKVTDTEKGILKV